MTELQIELSEEVALMRPQVVRWLSSGALWGAVVLLLASLVVFVLALVAMLAPAEVWAQFPNGVTVQVPLVNR